MKNSLETNLGLFVACTVIATAVIIEKLGDFSFLTHNYHVSARAEPIVSCRLLTVTIAELYSVSS